VLKWPWSNKKGKQESSQTGLLQIPVNEEGEVKANIVFVHGLGADRRLTWHWQKPGDSDWNENNFWPKWLGDDLPGFRVWLFGYDAKKFFLEKGKAAPRYDQAKLLLSYLKARQLADCPLWFVAHSLGGLVVKEMLRVAQDDNKPLLDQVRGVVFLATPHVGADLAKLGEIVRGISLNLLQVTVSVRELESHNAGLRGLDDWYRNNSRKIATLPFYEMYDTWGVKVVDEDSANPKVENQESFTPVPTDHIAIARCSSREELVFLTVKQFIQNNSEKPKGSIFKSDNLQQIAEELSRESTAQELPETDQNKIDDSKLFKFLKELNFSQECKQVREYINSRQMIGSFLMCGEKKNGIEILLERLSNQKKYFLITIDLGSNQGININLIWQKVAIELKQDKSSEREGVLSKIIEIQKEQSILFVLKSINKILPEDVSEVMKEFWGILIKKVQVEEGKDKNSAENNLFLFLVDYQERYRNTEFEVAFDGKIFPKNFTEDEIANWIDSVRNQWGSEKCDRLNLDCTKASYIFQESQQGIPYQVYRTIYEFFPLAWQKSKIRTKLI
jgi:pimeloyl-ACP methyl ester carboxylesterase